MPYLLLLILLAIIGGPWLVAFALTLTGVWFAMVWTIMGLSLIAALIGAGFAAVFLFAWFIGNWGQKKATTAFGAPLSEAFKKTHGVETGVWKDGTTYMVETNRQTFYFSNLEEARAARDHGIEGYAPAVPVPRR
jgi:hypothetical protein